MRTIDYLKEMGWNPSRKIDYDSILKEISNDGYMIFPSAVKFIESFGNLEGRLPAFKREGPYEKIHFSPVQAMENIYRERVETYETRVSEKLVIVGEAYNGNLVILISQCGKLYGAYDDYLCLLGQTPEQGIESLFEKIPSVEIP
jgi:hypothetical protein